MLLLPRPGGPVRRAACPGRALECIGAPLPKVPKNFGVPLSNVRRAAGPPGRGAFLSAHAGIEPVIIEKQAAYIQRRLKQLRGDKRMAIDAAGATQQAADWIATRGRPLSDF